MFRMMHVCSEEGQKTLKAKEEMEAAKQRRDIDAIAREKREAKEKQVHRHVTLHHATAVPTYVSFRTAFCVKSKRTK
jgi:hypothetical protein